MADRDGQGREALAKLADAFEVIEQEHGSLLYPDEMACHFLASDWLKAHDAELAAGAWDEGAKAAGGYGHEDGWTHNMNPFLDNPYRADEAPR